MLQLEQQGIVLFGVVEELTTGQAAGVYGTFTANQHKYWATGFVVSLVDHVSLKNGFCPS